MRDRSCARAPRQLYITGVRDIELRKDDALQTIEEAHALSLRSQPATSQAKELRALIHLALGYIRANNGAPPEQQVPPRSKKLTNVAQDPRSRPWSCTKKRSRTLKAYNSTAATNCCPSTST